MKRSYTEADIFHKPECMKCWAKYYCSGGCNANNYIYCGSVTKPYKMTCELERKRIECALYIKNELANEDGADERQ